MNFFYLANPKYGGWVSFTEHLMTAYAAAGHPTALLKVGKRTETSTRPFGNDFQYQNLSLAALGVFRGGIVTAYDKAHIEELAVAVRRGAAVVVHDPNEVYEEVLPSLKAAKLLITIRPLVQQLLQAKGFSNTVLIPHPYKRRYDKPPEHRKDNARAGSRIDWDKHTEIIAAANELLEPAQRCFIYGAENRMYAHHRLDETFVNWRHNYKGTFPRSLHAGAELAADAHYYVDMSVIKDDGGGSQYTFLEAWDAGSVCVINSEWVKPGGEMQPERNCVAVSTPEELAAVLRKDPIAFRACVKGGCQALAAHAPEAVVSLLEGTIQKAA